MPETAHSSLVWHDPTLPVDIFWTPEALERMRALAVDGLLSLPRVGLGVGGFLLGRRIPGTVVVQALRPIVCAYAAGPFFSPTEAETEKAIAGLAKRSPRFLAMDVLGYYCTRPRRNVELTLSDRVLFERLCPGPERILALVRPSATDATRAGVFVRLADGTIAEGVVRSVHPWTPPVAEEPEAPQETDPEEPIPAPAPVTVAAPVPEPEPLFEPAPAAALEPEPVAEHRPLFGTPAPVFTAPEEKPRRFGWKIPAYLAGLAVFIAGAALTRDQWAPRPALELHAAEINGRFSFEWNRAAVRGISRGELTVTDGNVTRTLPLTRYQLEQGAYVYTRQSPQVSALLVAGDSRAPAKFTAPPAPPPPPVVDQADDPPVTPAAATPSVAMPPVTAPSAAKP